MDGEVSRVIAWYHHWPPGVGSHLCVYTHSCPHTHAWEFRYIYTHIPTQPQREQLEFVQPGRLWKEAWELGTASHSRNINNKLVSPHGNGVENKPLEPKSNKNAIFFLAFLNTSH